MSEVDEIYMKRCLQLAELGAGSTAPNPMVGAVLVYGDRIIGEGYHHGYGKAHAEVNCLQNVAADDRSLIADSILYVSLEPCAHHGKTPPCADLIISSHIPKVVVGCMDIFAKVAGKGIEKMKNAGVDVIAGILEDECRGLNRRFFVFHAQRRPYVVLKWAQTKEGFIARADGRPMKISNVFTDRLVHRWRSEEAAILVGKNTVLKDDPLLTNRLWSGSSPLRIVTDRYLNVPETARILQDGRPLLIYNTLVAKQNKRTEWIKLDDTSSFLDSLLKHLYTRNILSVLVEGGAEILRGLLDMGCWDEARVIHGNVSLAEGKTAPVLSHHELVETLRIRDDELCIYKRDQ